MNITRKTAGFTIIEVLVALFLFMLLLIIIISPTYNSYKMLNVSKSDLQGSSDASKDLEKARQITITNYSNAANLQTALTALNLGSDLTCNNINIFGTVISPCSAADNPPMRQLTLTRTLNGKPLQLQVSVRP